MVHLASHTNKTGNHIATIHSCVSIYTSCNEREIFMLIYSGCMYSNLLNYSEDF